MFCYGKMWIYLLFPLNGNTWKHSLVYLSIIFSLIRFRPTFSFCSSLKTYFLMFSEGIKREHKAEITWTKHFGMVWKRSLLSILYIKNAFLYQKCKCLSYLVAVSMKGVIISFILFFFQQHCLAGWQQRHSDRSQISRNLNLQSHSRNVTVSVKFKLSTIRYSSKATIDPRFLLLTLR